MMRLCRCLSLVAVVILNASAAFALPTLSVSSPTSVDIGASFSVDILISDVDAGSPLNAFELDLIFDSSNLTATSVVDGGFLLDPIFVVQNSIGAVSVEFAEVTLLAAGASGAGTLATIQFDAILAGVSGLDLSNVILSAPFGVQIDTAAVVDGLVTVVPEPSAPLLSLVGLAVVAAQLRRRTR